METALRNTLRLAIASCRRLLEEDFRLHMEGRYDIRDPQDLTDDGASAYLDYVGQIDRQAIAAAIQHEIAQGNRFELAFDRFVRESAFTTLNRLAALKLLEHPKRALIPESIGKKDNSKGFTQFAKVSPEALRGAQTERTDGGFCLYLQMLFDDLSHAVGVLFDRSLPQSILFPSTTCLSAVLDLLNQPELEPVWPEDETIGWIYQYFTPPELRDQVRKESSAPRNSYELAFRNQFYTPRYVVEFLTDNTLGRTWYEMRQGQTRLTEQCHYLVCPPVEIYLEDKIAGFDRVHPGILSVMLGDFSELPEAPSETDWQRLALMVNGYKIAELLGPKKASAALELIENYPGSHLLPTKSHELWHLLFVLQRREGRAMFGLSESERRALPDVYAALRRALQEESGNTGLDVPHYLLSGAPREPKDPRDLRVLDPACGSGHFLLYAFELLETIYLEDYDTPSNASRLAEDFPDRQHFLRELPRLIVEHNLHGIDIDLRAAQIAALALWLRAQRAYSEMKIPARKRPRIRRSNIVCAEPMPGEYDLLGEFLRELKPMVLGRIVMKVWERMKVAGEAGSLLKIEREMRAEIHQAHEMLKKAPQPMQFTLYGPNQPAVQQILHFDEITDEAFWEQSEQRVLEELQRYAQQAGGQNVTRRLFAHDAGQGFAFVSLLQQPFDIVLMNPPFGAPSLGSRDYLLASYPRTKNDLYAAFVERGLELLHPGGMLGAITSRTGFFLKSFQQWREEILLKDAQLTVMADLGYGVLDTAMVETAAYVVKKI